MSDGPGGPEGPAVGASVESVSAPSGVETTATPVTPETTKSAFEISQEATGSETASNIQNLATTAGIENTFDKLSKDGAIEDNSPTPTEKNTKAYEQYQKTMRTEQVDSDEPSIKPDENPVTFANVDEYKKNFAAVQADDIDTNTPQNTESQTPASPPEADTKTNQPTKENNQTPTDTKTDGKEPVEDKEMTGEEFLDKMNKDIDARKTHENWKKIWDATGATNKDTDSGKINDQTETPAEDKKPVEASPAYQSQKDTNPDNENKVHQSQAHTNPDITRDQAESPTEDKKPVETSPTYQSQKDTNPDRQRDQVEPPTEDKKNETQEEVPENEFKSPGDIQNEIQNQKDEKGNEKTDEEKGDEKNEDPKSEKAKQIEEKMQMADIVNQIKDINPDFDPKNPEAQAFLKNLAENPDQMKTADDTLKMLSEQKTVLENSDAIKSLGISPKDLVGPAAIGTLKALSGTIEKAIKELAGKPNLTKEEQDKNKKDGLLLSILKALGLLLGAGSAAVLAAGKELKK